MSAMEARIGSLETRVSVEAKGTEGISVRLDKIEDTLSWLSRLIVGAIILGVLGFALSGGMK